MLCWEYPPRIIGGLARVVAELSYELVHLGWEVHVVTADHPGTKEHEIDNGVHGWFRERKKDTQYPYQLVGDAHGVHGI